MEYQVSKTDDQWREELSDEQYAVLREAGTCLLYTSDAADEL